VGEKVSFFRASCRPKKETFPLFLRAKRAKKDFSMKYTRYFILLIFFNINLSTQAQSSISEQEAIDLALKNHPSQQRHQNRIAQTQALLPTAKTMLPTEFSAETPQFLMGPDNSAIWTTLGAQQSFLSRKVYRQNEKVLQQNVKVAQAEQAMSAFDIRFQVRQLYQNCLFSKEKVRFSAEQDSVFKEMNRIAEVEYKVGKITALEKTVIESFYLNIRQILRGGEMAFQNAQMELAQYLKTPQVIVNQYFTRLKTPVSIEKKEPVNLPIQAFYKENIGLQNEKIAQQKLALTPSYNVGVSQYIFNRLVPPVVRVGVSLPLWKTAYNAQAKAAELEGEIAKNDLQNLDFQLNNDFQKAVNDVKLAEQNLDFYTQIGLKQADEILTTAYKIYKLGSVTALEYLQSIKQAYELKSAYLMALKSYNEAVLKVEYFTN
jgi:outer membrane protein TolC